MADVEFSHDMGAYGRGAESQNSPNSLVTMTNVAGALVSIALIAGVGVWGYKLMVRDVSGIPVVRAAEGEMRVRPADPGGQLAQHQGLAVNAVAAVGVAAGPVDQVILAPRPLTLTDEDQPVILPAPVTAEPETTVVPEEPTIVPDIQQRLQQGAIDAVVAELTQGSAPMVQVSSAKTVQATRTGTPSADAPAQTEQESAASEVKPVERVVLDAPGVRASIRPRLRPDDVSALIQTAAYTPEAPRAEIDPDAIPAGTRLAQLGAFDSPEVARTEWTRLEARFGPYLQDKSRVVQRAQSNGRTFYRLRAMGFVDLSDARRFCSAFKAEGVDCIPVQAK